MTEKTADIYQEQSVPMPDGTSARRGLFEAETKWAVLVNENLIYRLHEKDIPGCEAQKLMKGKYRGRDVILTVFSGDLAARIDSLNAALI